MVWGDIMASFWSMCVITSAIARFIPIFKLEYFWNAKTYTGEILIWCHIDGVLSEKPQNTHNLNCLFFNGCLGWKFKNCWNDCVAFRSDEGVSWRRGSPWPILPHPESAPGLPSFIKIHQVVLEKKLKMWKSLQTDDERRRTDERWTVCYDNSSLEPSGSL